MPKKHQSQKCGSPCKKTLAENNESLCKQNTLQKKIANTKNLRTNKREPLKKKKTCTKRKQKQTFCKSKQNKTKQNRIKQNRTKQNKTKPLAKNSKPLAQTKNTRRYKKRAKK